MGLNSTIGVFYTFFTQKKHTRLSEAAVFGRSLHRRAGGGSKDAKFFKYSFISNGKHAFTMAEF